LADGKLAESTPLDVRFGEIRRTIEKMLPMV